MTIVFSHYCYSHFIENEGVNDPNLFEGDMILTSEQRYRAEHGMDVNFGDNRKRGARKGGGLWPNGVVVYEIAPDLGKFLISESFVQLWLFELLCGRRVPNGFFNLVIPTQTFLQYCDPESYFLHPTLRVHFQSPISPPFCFKILNPELQIKGKSRIP